MTSSEINARNPRNVKVHELPEGWLIILGCRFLQGQSVERIRGSFRWLNKRSLKENRKKCIRAAVADAPHVWGPYIASGAKSLAEWKRLKNG